MKQWHGVTAMVVAISMLGGCQNGDDTAGRLLIDPLVAQQLDYSVDWQIDLALPERSELIYAELLGDRLVTLEDQNIVTVIDAGNGRILWRQQVTQPRTELSRPQRDGNRLVISSQQRGFVYDINRGDLENIVTLRHVSLGTPVVGNGIMIHSSPRGVLFAQELDNGLLAWNYQIDVGFASSPTVIGERLFATDLAGNIWCFNPDSGSLFWSQRVAEPVVAAPAASDRLVYVPSTDQSLYALRLNNGSRQGRYYATSSLNRSPFLLDDLLLQEVSNDALVSLDPEQVSNVRWRSTELLGARPLQVRGSTIDFYHNRQLLHVDASDGSIIGTTEMRNVRHVIAANRRGGDLYLVQLNGRILKASPR